MPLRLMQPQLDVRSVRPPTAPPLSLPFGCTNGVSSAGRANSSRSERASSTALRRCTLLPSTLPSVVRRKVPSSPHWKNAMSPWAGTSFCDRKDDREIVKIAEDAVAYELKRENQQTLRTPSPTARKVFADEMA